MGSPSILRVFEIYESLQGESTRAGLACTLVRLAGCPLRCGYCDTPLARDADGEEMEVGEITRRVLEFGHGLAEVTGGEPLHQPHTPELLTALCDAGLEVLLETSGAFAIDGLDPRVRVVMDLKAPGSGMADRMLPANLELLRPERDELKFAITSRDDFDWVVSTVRAHGLVGRVPLLVSPVGGAAEPADAAQWILECKEPLRLQLQLHKIIWGEEEGR